MLNKRAAIWISLLLVVGLVLAGCGARSGAGETAAAFKDGTLVVDVPSLVVDYDADGNPSVGSTPLSSLQSVLPADVVKLLTLDKGVIDTMTGANIQHIQISNVPGGVRILVNGQAVPSLAWDGEALTNATELAGALGPALPASLKGLLPVLTNLGAGVALRFPPAQGAETIPLVVPADQSKAATAQAAQQEFMKQAGTAPEIRIPVTYSADGSWTVQGMTDSEWQALTGVPFGALRLDPELLKSAAAAGITNAVVSTDPQGIHIDLNGKKLPYIAWGSGEINQALELAEQTGALSGLPGGMDADSFVKLVETLLPALQSSNVTIQVAFPSQ